MCTKYTFMQLNSMTCFGWKIYIFYGFLSTIMSKKEGKHDLTSSEVHAAIASQKTSENAAVVFVVIMCLYWTVW